MADCAEIEFHIKLNCGSTAKKFKKIIRNSKKMKNECIKVTLCPCVGVAALHLC